MSVRSAGSRYRAAVRPLWAVLAVALAGCGPKHVVEAPGPARFTSRIHDILATEWTAPEYADARAKIDALGPEVDAVLVALARDPNANTTARANALLLLADRSSPAAIAALRRALLTEEIPRLRSAAVFGLNRLADTSAAAASMLKAAVGDPVRSVRLNALQALDIREVETIRSVIENDRDREVRAVAMQLLALAESRGASLAPDRRGALRTTGSPDQPAIVFRATRIDTIAGAANGDLRVELPDAPDIPLAGAAEMVAGVVPAFFSADRSRVVYEAEREIRTVDLESREVRVIGPGIAPRLIPFSDYFLFVREQEGGRIASDGITRISYDVYRASFAGGDAEIVGEMTAALRQEVRANYSPVRWMVVGESPQGFVLRGQGITPFPIQAPAFRQKDETGAPGAPNHEPIWGW